MRPVHGRAPQCAVSPPSRRRHVAHDGVGRPGHSPGRRGPHADAGSVNLAGSIESEATGGACGDWDPACVGSRFAAQPNDVFVFQSAPVPAGSYEYKVAMGSWDENYGADFKQNGPNIAVTVPAERTMRFYYDHKTHFIADNVRGTAYTVPGSFNTQLGCAGDWQPDCLATFMNDVDGDGTFTFVTDEVVPGSYEFKVTAGESWDQNWPAGQQGVHRHRARRHGDRQLHPGPNTVDVVVESGPSTEPGDEDLALDSLREDLTEENFYFVMADRFANGDDDQRHRRARPAAGWSPATTRPTRASTTAATSPGSTEQARLHQGPGHHRDLDDPVVQEPPGAGHRRRRVAPATTATGSPTSPRSTRTSAPTPS